MSCFVRQPRLKLLILILLAAIAAGGIYAWSILRSGFSAKAEPSAAEAFVARRLRRLAIPKDAREARNPVQLTAEVMAGAKEHYADHCAVCHGNDGRGATLLGKGLYPKPPDMTAADTQQLTDGEIYYIIENGIRFTGMPGFGEEPGNLQNEETWHLVHFIRHIPSLTDDEVAELKKMNPKSPAELAKEEKIRKFLQGEDSHEHKH
jgi:mono/diheme cytochrome c family protein